jgi:hypothetical protein
VHAVGVRSTHTINGTLRHTERPDWTPLESLVRDVVVAAFMYMFEVELADGTRLHAYKHQMTRGYVHIADDGRVFAYVSDARDCDGEARYREVDPLEQLAAACGEWGPWWPAMIERRRLRAVVDEHGEEGEP